MDNSDKATTASQADKPKFSLERFMVVVFVSVVAAALSAVFMPRNAESGHIIPGLCAVITTLSIFDLRDRQRKGELSAAEFRRKVVRILIGMTVLCSIMLAPFFIWPDDSFKMFLVVSIPLLVVTAVVTSLISHRRKKKQGK